MADAPKPRDKSCLVILLTILGMFVVGSVVARQNAPAGSVAERRAVTPKASSPAELLAVIETRRNPPEATKVKEVQVFLTALNEKCQEEEVAIGDQIAATMKYLKDDYNITRNPTEIAKWANTAIPREAAGSVKCAEIFVMYMMFEKSAKFGD